MNISKLCMHVLTVCPCTLHVCLHVIAVTQDTVLAVTQDTVIAVTQDTVIAVTVHTEQGRKERVFHCFQGKTLGKNGLNKTCPGS